MAFLSTTLDSQISGFSPKKFLVWEVLMISSPNALASWNVLNDLMKMYSSRRLMRSRSCLVISSERWRT